MENLLKLFKSDKEKKVAILTTAAVLLFAVIVAGCYWLAGTPQYSLLKLALAFKNHDSAGVYRYIDTDRIVNSIVDVAFDSDMAEGSNSDNLEESFAKGFLMLMKSQMTEMLKQEVRNIVTKTVESPDDGSVINDRMKSIKQTNNFGIIKKLLFEKNISIKRSGKTATLEMVVDNDSIKLKMIQIPDRRWQIVEIDSEVFRNALEEDSK